MNNSFDEGYKKWKEEQQKSETKVSFEAGYSNWLLQNREGGAESLSKEIENRVNTWLQNNNNFIENAKYRSQNRGGYVADSGEWLSTITTQKNNFDREAESIKSLLNQYKDVLNPEWVSSISSVFDSNGKTQADIVSGFTEENSYWSQFENEDVYNEWVAWEQRQKFLLHLDVDAAKKQAETYESAISEANDLAMKRNELETEYGRLQGTLSNEVAPEEETSRDRDRLTQLERALAEIERQERDIGAKYGIVGDFNAGRLKEQATKLREDATYAEYRQMRESLTSEALSAPDFETKNQYGTTTPAGVESVKAYMFLHPELTMNNVITDPNHEWYGGGTLFEPGHDFYEAMSEEEKKILGYYLAHDVKKAENYIKALTDATSVGGRVGAMYQEKADDWYDKVLFSLAAGTDQFSSGLQGVGNAIMGVEEYIPPSPIQQGSAGIRQDIEDGEGFWNGVLGVTYDLGSTTANMLPSILVGIANPTAGVALMGASAGGNAYNEMINLGYSKNQARAYGVMVGASEALLEKALGGITAFGGGSGALANKLLTKVDNAFARWAIQTGGSMLSEFTEESLQTILEPWFKSIVTGADYDAPDIDEVLYSGLLGALSAGVLEGGSNTINTGVTTYRGSKVKKTDGAVEKLKKLGTSFSADSVASQLAGRVTNKSGAYTIGRLFQEVGATLSAQNKSDIIIGLTKRGVDESSAKKIANTYEAFLNGEMSLTDEQVRTLEGLDPLNDVLKKNIIGVNTDVYQRTREYSDLVNLAKGMDSKTDAPSASNADTNETPQTFAPYSKQYIETMAKEFEAMGMPAEHARIMAQSKLSASTQDNVSPTAENAVESKFGVSVEGKTIKTDTGEIVKIKNIEGISSNGEANLTLDDGMVVKASDLSYGNDAEAIFIENIGKIKIGKNPISTTSANALYMTAMSALESNPNMTADEAMSLIKGLEESYVYGTYNLGRSKLTARNEDGTARLFAGELSQDQRKYAYELGTQDAVNKADADQKVIDDLRAKAEGKSPKKTLGKVIFEKGAEVADESALTDTQRANLNGIKLLAEISSVEFHVFRSDKNNKFKYTMPDGTVTTANGWFVAGTNQIWIDLNAGNSGEGTMVRTAAHEISHYIKEWSPQKWKAMADMLMETFAKNGVDTESMLNKQIAKIKRRYNKNNMPSVAVLEDMAYEELVSDALTDMLTDGSIVNFIAEVKAKDASLGKKIINAIKNLLKKWGLIIDSYKGRDLDTAEAQALSQFEDTFKKLQELYREAFMDANATVALLDGAKPISPNEIITDGATVTDSDGNVYSIRSMKSDIAEGQMFEDLKAYCGFTQSQVNTLKKQLEDLVEYMTPFRDILDMNETYGREGRRYAPYKPNSDPLYTISLDFSTQCSKRLLTQYVIEQLQLRENRPMSAEEQMAIRDMLKEYGKIEKGLQVACVMCYVEAARLKAPKQIQKWINDPATAMRNFFANKNPEFAAYIKKAQEDFKESRGYARNATKKDMKAKDVRALNQIRPKLRAEYKASAEEMAIIETAKSLPNSTYLTAGNLADLSETHPEIYKAYTAFIRTATRSKALETDEPYYYGDSRRDNGNGIIVSDSFIEAVNRENGMRFSSWSDWRIQHLLDWITAVVDNSVRGAAMHGYTKYGDEVRVLGKTGMMFNMSGVPGTQTGLNEDGSLNFSETESMDYNEAIALRKEFPETAGLQCIGVSKEHIFALLRSDIIDYVIPYHTSGLNATLRRMGDIYGWEDFTLTQHATENKSIKKENAIDPEHWHQEPVFSEFFVGYNTGLGGIEAMRKSADNYIRMCEERGLTPKFVEFSKEPNYWKLLIDRKMVNQKTNTLIKQKPVTPTFEFGVIKGIVDQYVKNYDGGLEERAFNHIVKNWDSVPQRIKDLKKQGTVKAKSTKKAIDKLANEPLAVQPKGEIKPSERDRAPIFYSQMSKVIEGVKQEKLAANSVVNMLRGKGVKAEEIRWSGIVPFLEGKKSVTKQELLDFINGSMLQIGEQMSNEEGYGIVRDGDNYIVLSSDGVVLDTWEKTVNPEDPEMFGWISREGGDIAASVHEIREYSSDWYGGEGTRWSQYRLDGGTNYRELVFTMPNSTYTNQAMRAHWGQDAEGILVHARIQDFNVKGKKMLFIEELQSDYHNEGHQSGYQTVETDAKIDELKAIAEEKYFALEDYSTELTGLAGEWEAVEKTAKGAKLLREYREAQSAYDNAMNDYVKKIPDAPFKDNYHEYVLKRLIRMAAEQGYDSIGWTPSEIQSDRWSDEFAEGYRIEYDQEMPKFLRKYGRQWGAKVGKTAIAKEAVEGRERLLKETELANVKRDIESAKRELARHYDSYEKALIQRSIDSMEKTVATLEKELSASLSVWSMDITDSMKDSVLYEGQVMFSERVTDEKTLDFLNEQIDNGEYITVYRSFQVIDGGLYAPMNSVDRDEDGKNKRLGYRSEIGKWEKATESRAIAQRYMDTHPDAPYAKFDLDGGDNKTGGVAYNPYLHASNLVLNDQFAAAYRRNLVTVECRVPLSEAEGAYKADYAKDGTGWANWKAGGVAGQLKKIKPEFERRLFLSRYMLPVKILSDAEVAQTYKDYLDGTDISVPWNVVTPSLRKELEKVGVNISYKDVKQSNGLLKFEEQFPEEVSKVLYSERDTDSSNRAILANALESVAQNDIERNKLAQYKEKISLIEAEEQRLSEIQKKLFTKGEVEPTERKSLQFEAKQISNRINTYDRQLFNLESTTALKNVLNREKALATKKQKQRDNEYLKQYKEKVAKDKKVLLERNQESRKKAIEGREKTAMRHKIKSVVNDLNNLLLKPSKERHVPEEMRIAVAEALAIVNMDTVDADTRVAHYNDLIAKAKDPDVIASLTETRDRILNQGNKLAEKLTKLKDAYSMVRDSADDSLRGIYDDVIYSRIESVQKVIGKTPLRNMTLGQLESVYDLYKMVLTTIRDSNKAFAENITQTRLALGSNTFAEIKEGHKTRDTIKHPHLEKFLWQTLKPMQAMKTIGSGTLQKLWNNILYGQETFAQDYDEAVKFAKEMKDKHGYEKWNKDKLYSFDSKSGKTMKLTLEQMMSIYAYSKRAQADEHIEYGGIVLNEGVIKVKNKLGKTVEVKVNDSTAYRLDKMQVASIVATLEKVAPGAKAFVDEMQKYLSETMGEKGNEVSMKMYGIKLFKEEHYFPLKSSKDFMEAANAKLKGDVKIKNKGMTKSTVEHARNPIVLENFLDVWGNHINEMAMYHGLVLPLEDFSRTLNYSFKADDQLNTDAESVRTALHDAFGDNADNYLNELLKAINGGVLHDSSAQFADRMISKFKKSKVMASLSVIVQQPTAIIRAMGIIEPKYFVAQNFNHKATWEELKKYCPTAIIKETGSFDTNMGRTIVDMIKDERGFTDKVGDVLGKAPAFMDEMGWNMIWRALKKKVATEQNLSGEALLQECGKQMTLILNETQVYDSVMSRNELMRSKSAFTKMATAFMGEPTTVANMIYGAGLDFKRGKKGVATKTVAATIASVVINGLVSAIVYAMRDDDEEKTFLEKYISSATTEVVDGLNPLTYIPFVKDAYSLFQGYKVERTDMALIKDVVDAIDDFYNVLDPEEYEGMSEEEIAKHIYENSVPLLTAICDMFGLPVGNVLRDAEAIIVQDNAPMSQTSSMGTWGAFKEGILSSLPQIVSKFIGTESKQDQLYDAIVSGDTAYIERLKSGYKDEASYETAVRKALRENDERIKEAAEAYNDGDIRERDRILAEIVAEGFFDEDLVIGAITAEADALKGDTEEESEAEEEKATSIYKADDVNVALESGDTELALEIIDDLVKTKVENGMEEDKAKSSVKSSVTSHWKPLYKAAYKNKDSEEMTRIRKLLFDSGLYGRASQVSETCRDWIKELAKEKNN